MTEESIEQETPWAPAAAYEKTRLIWIYDGLEGDSRQNFYGWQTPKVQRWLEDHDHAVALECEEIRQIESLGRRVSLDARVLHIDQAAALVGVSEEDLMSWIDEGIIEVAYPEWAYADEWHGLPSVRGLVAVTHSSPFDSPGNMLERAEDIGLSAIDRREIAEAFEALGAVDPCDEDNPDGAPGDLTETSWWKEKRCPLSVRSPIWKPLAHRT